MSNSSMTLRKGKNSGVLNVNNLTRADIKISTPNLIKQEIYSLFNEKTRKNENQKKHDRISKISNCLEKIFDNQIDKIKRNYSYSQEKKLNDSNSFHYVSVERSKNSDQSKNLCNSNRNELNPIIDYLHKKHEISKCNTNQSINQDDISSNRNSYRNNKIDCEVLKGIQPTEKAVSYNTENLLNKSKVSTKMHLPPRMKRPPIKPKEMNKTVNKENNNCYQMSSSNFSLNYIYLKNEDSFSANLENKKIENCIGDCKAEKDLIKNTNFKQVNDSLYYSSRQESFSIKNKINIESKQISFNISSIEVDSSRTTNLNNIIIDTSNKEECNIIKYTKPKIKSSSYRSNKENSNLLSNFPIKTIHESENLNSLENIDCNENQQINTKDSLELQLRTNSTNHLENARLSNKIPSLDSTFLDYEYKTNKIRIVSNKPSINISQIENESFNETSINKNSQCNDLYCVSYMSEDTKGFINKSLLEKSKAEDKHMLPKQNRNNSSILYIKGAVETNNILEDTRQFNTDNNSLSMDIDFKVKNNSTQNKSITKSIADFKINNRRVVDYQLNKDFESFKTKRNKNYTVDYDTCYSIKDQLRKKENITLSFNEKFDRDPDTSNWGKLKEIPMEYPKNKKLNLKDIANDSMIEGFNERKIQRLKSYKSIKLLNVESLINKIPPHDEAFNSPNVDFIRPTDNILKTDMKSNISEFHPLELENTLTSISITASQNFKRNVIGICPTTEFEKGEEKNEIAIASCHITANQARETNKSKISSDKVDKIAQSMKKNFSSKKLPIYKNFDSSKKKENINDNSSKRNSKVPNVDNMLQKTRTLSKNSIFNKSIGGKSLNNSFNTKLVIQSKNSISDRIREKDANPINTFKIKI